MNRTSNSQVDSQFINNYIEKWYNASEKNINTNEKNELYKEGTTLTEFFKNHAEQPKESSELCFTFIEEVKRQGPKKSQSLAKCIANNTQSSYTKDEIAYTGAYDNIHKVFKAVIEIQPTKSTPLIEIDSKAKNYIEKNRKGFEDFASKQHIISHLDLKSLLQLALSSKENYKVVRIKQVIVRRLNQGEIKIKDERELKKLIKNLEKEYCQRVKSLDIVCDFFNHDLIMHFPKLENLTLLTLSSDENHMMVLTNLANLKSINLNCPNLETLLFYDCINLEEINLNCPTLETLNLQNTKFKDVTKLVNLQNLKDLGLDLTEVKDISPLANFNLESLIIGNILSQDIRPLANFSTLKSLSLGDVLSQDFSLLANLQNLTILQVGKVEDIKPLVHLQNLTSLCIKGIEDIGSIAHLLPNLHSLQLIKTKISDISHIALFQKLESFSIKDSEVKLKDITSLDNLPRSLKHIHLISRSKNTKKIGNLTIHY